MPRFAPVILTLLLISPALALANPPSSDNPPAVKGDLKRQGDAEAAYNEARELDIQIFREWQQARFAANAAKSVEEKQKIMGALATAQVERRKRLLELRKTTRSFEQEQQAAAAKARSQSAPKPEVK